MGHFSPPRMKRARAEDRQNTSNQNKRTRSNAYQAKCSQNNAYQDELTYPFLFAVKYPHACTKENEQLTELHQRGVRAHLALKQHNDTYKVKLFVNIGPILMHRGEIITKLFAGNSWETLDNNELGRTNTSTTGVDSWRRICILKDEWVRSGGTCWLQSFDFKENSFEKILEWIISIMDRNLQQNETWRKLFSRDLFTELNSIIISFEKGYFTHNGTRIHMGDCFGDIPLILQAAKKCPKIRRLRIGTFTHGDHVTTKDLDNLFQEDDNSIRKIDFCSKKENPPPIDLYEHLKRDYKITKIVLCSIFKGTIDPWCGIYSSLANKNKIHQDLSNWPISLGKTPTLLKTNIETVVIYGRLLQIPNELIDIIIKFYGWALKMMYIRTNPIQKTINL